MAVNCSKCGVRKGLMDTLTGDLGATGFVCQDCQEAAKIAEKNRIERIRQAARNVIVTTTPKVDGHYAATYLGIESVEFVIGTGIFSEMSSSLADFFGARSGAFESKLQVAKRHAMAALKFIAAEKGADAVVGIDLDYAEFSGNRVALIINGTLVKLAPLRATAAAGKRPDPEL